MNIIHIVYTLFNNINFTLQCSSPLSVVMETPIGCHGNPQQYDGLLLSVKIACIEGC